MWLASGTANWEITKQSSNLEQKGCQMQYSFCLYDQHEESQRLLRILLFPLDMSNVEHWLLSVITPNSPMWTHLIFQASWFYSSRFAEITLNRLSFTWIENEWRWIKICCNTKLIRKNPLSICIVLWWHPDGSLCVDFATVLFVSVCHRNKVRPLPLLLFYWKTFFSYLATLACWIFIWWPSKKCESKRELETDQRSVSADFFYWLRRLTCPKKSETS